MPTTLTIFRSMGFVQSLVAHELQSGMVKFKWFGTSDTIGIRLHLYSIS